MIVGELKGFKALAAFYAFQTLMFGVKMIPAYQAIEYEEFYDLVHKMSEEDREKVIRHAAFFVPLKKDEVEAIVSLVHDKNGVPYGASNLNNLGPNEIVDAIVAVSLKIASLEVRLVSELEKKNSRTSQLI